MSLPSSETVKDYIRQRYGAIAEQDAAADCGGAPSCGGGKTNEQKRAETGCCAPTCCDSPAGQSYGERLGYSAAELAAVPAGADLGLGCGNPLALASIRPGETVLDLGSGAGFDALLAARQLAGTGRVIGVDMTPAMVAKARRNAAPAGFANVEFRLGEIEALPVADASVDLIISNCVINLSPEKSRVFAEAFRVLKSGGRLAISDIVATRPLPEAMRAKLPLVGACIGGAIVVEEMQALLAAAGFTRVEVRLEPDSRSFIAQWSDDPTIADYLVSANITAHKA
jgi:SAM-dependent methyltransferase